MRNIPSLSFGTISERVSYLAEHYPDRELFVFYQGKKRLPYTAREIFELAGKFAYRLRHQYGFKRDDVIINNLPNSPERVITDLGTTLAGIICMNGQILLQDGADFFHSATKSRCNGVILCQQESSPAWRLLGKYVADSSSLISQLKCTQIPDTTKAILVSRDASGSQKSFLDDLRNSYDAVFVDNSIRPEDVMYVFATSGSTGYSKLVPRTHSEIIDVWAFINVFEQQVSETTGDVILYSDRLLGWVAGYPYGTYCAGDKRVLLDLFEGGGKRGDYSWSAICTEKCSLALILPLDLHNVLQYVGSIGGATYKVKTLLTGGQPLNKFHMSGIFSIAEQAGITYGSTEAGGLCYAILSSPDVEDFWCGKPLPGVEIKIFNESGKECKAKQSGIVHAKGPGIFKGYFNRQESPDPNTAKCFTKDGWFNTEDIGFLDKDGNVYVMGRNKDTIIYGSAVLYTAWLESKLMQHTDVAEAVIVPVSDPVLFQEICACVQPVRGSNLTEEKLKSFCESMFLADLSSELTPVPKYYMILDSFPQTITGKPNKLILKQMAEQKFGSA